MTTKTVTGLFDKYDDAAKAVQALESAGIPARDISLVANNAEGHTVSVATTEAGTGAGTGATLGGVAGGAAGVLAGLGILAIPGVGPVVAAGWLVAAAAGAAIGATAGAAAGGLTGLFISAGLSPDDANFYAESIRRGGTVVTVKPDDKHMEIAEQILRRGTVSPTERIKLYRDSGWREFNSQAIPYTPAEIEAERKRYNSSF